MNRFIRYRTALAVWAVCTLSSEGACAAIAWQSTASLHEFPKKKVHGTFLLDDSGAEFRSPKFSQRWPYQEIKTIEIPNSRELIVTDYESRRRHMPGERRFHFVFSAALPPDLATQLVARVAKPVINGDPDASLTAIAEMPAHRRERFGGSDGTLRFREDGIDYVAANGRDSRSWRWSDIETLANPGPFEFRVSAWREIVEFDLKAPLSRELFDRLWDRLYASDLNLATPHGERHQ